MKWVLGVSCQRWQEWYIPVSIGVGVIIVGGLLMALCRFIWYRTASEDDRYRSWPTWQCSARLRALAVNLVGGQTVNSKILQNLVFLCNLGSIVLYLLMTSRYFHDQCYRMRDDPYQVIYSALCGVFVFNLSLRFIAANDKFYFWFDLYALVDHMTLLPTFYLLWADVNWIGLRSLRMLYLIQLPEIGQMNHLLKSDSTIKLTQMASILVSVWFTCSGIVHLLEHNGSERSELNFWDAVYWLLVTMSTVGYGDFSPTTVLSKIFTVLFIVGSIAMFTALIPDILASLDRDGKYKKPYNRLYGRRHVIICGNINETTVCTFVKDFNHPDAQNRDINVVIVHSAKPTLQMEAFFRRHASEVTYIQGSMMELDTISNAKVHDAVAVVVLANRSCEDPDEEDNGNIMRAAAVKISNPSARVIIQILQHHNKIHLLSIPHWNWHSDCVICIAELKLGLMAQNCMAPGISTLLANLFTMRSFKGKRSKSWRDSYGEGAGNELYRRKFGHGFIGMTFSKAAELCYTKENIALLALHVPQDGGGRDKLFVNPPDDIVIRARTAGFFIAQGPGDVHWVTKYGPRNKRRAGAKNTAYVVDDSDDMIRKEEDREASEVSGMVHISGFQTSPDFDSYPRRRSSTDQRLLTKYQVSTTEDELAKRMGSIFHWCSFRSLDDVILDSPNESPLIDLCNHVVVCLVSNEGAPIIGLANLVKPLRVRTIPETALKPIIILGNPEFIRNEWHSLGHYPQVYIFKGAPSNWSALRAVDVESSDMCVILSAKRRNPDDITLADKECILTNLNVQGIVAKEDAGNRRSGSLCGARQGDKSMKITTEIELEANLFYLGTDPEDGSKYPLYMTRPFACGSALATTCFDTLISAILHDTDLLSLVRALITGSDIDELQHALLEEGCQTEQAVSTEDEVIRAQSKLTLLPLSALPGLLDSHQNLCSYGDLYVKGLRAFNCVCLGISRLFSEDAGKQRNGVDALVDDKRFVITNPPHDFKLLPTDKIYCLLRGGMIYEISSDSAYNSGPSLDSENGTFTLNGAPPTVNMTSIYTELPPEGAPQSYEEAIANADHPVLIPSDELSNIVELEEPGSHSITENSSLATEPINTLRADPNDYHSAYPNSLSPTYIVTKL